MADSYISSNDLDLFADDATLFAAGAPEQPNQSDANAGDSAQTTPQAGQPDGAASETPDASKTSADWRKALEEATDPKDLLTRLARSVSRDDLLRDPTLAGIVGDAADKLERRRAADRQREHEEAATAAARAERERKLDEAADAEDLLTLGELTLEERKAAREERARQEEVARASTQGGELLSRTAKQTLDAYVDAQPPEVKAAIAQLAADPQRYAGLSWDDGYRKWLDDVISVKVEHARGTWDKSTREAIRKDELGRAEQDEPNANPEIGNNGQASTSDLISQATWEQNRGNASWRRQNLDRIMRSVAAGQIHD